MAEDTALRLSTPSSPVQGGRGGTLGRLGDTRGNLGSGGRGMQGGGVAGGSVLRHIPASSQLTRHRRAPVAGGSSLTKGVLPLSGPFNVDRRRRTPLSIARIVIRFSPILQHWKGGAGASSRVSSSSPSPPNPTRQPQALKSSSDPTRQPPAFRPRPRPTRQPQASAGIPTRQHVPSAR